MLRNISPRRCVQPAGRGNSSRVAAACLSTARARPGSKVQVAFHVVWSAGSTGFIWMFYIFLYGCFEHGILGCVENMDVFFYSYMISWKALAQTAPRTFPVLFGSVCRHCLEALAEFPRALIWSSTSSEAWNRGLGLTDKTPSSAAVSEVLLGLQLNFPVLPPLFSLGLRCPSPGGSLQL